MQYPQFQSLSHKEQRIFALKRLIGNYPDITVDIPCYSDELGKAEVSRYSMKQFLREILEKEQKEPVE